MSSLGRHRFVAKRSRLLLEVLEDRAMPATVVFSGGSLTISNPTGPSLQVTETKAGYFSIIDNGHSSGTYAVSGNITITGSNRPNLISVTLNDFQATGSGDLLGSLTIYGGNSADTISVDGTSGLESIRGNLYIDGGSSNDAVNVGTVIGLTVRGNATIIGNLGNDTALIGNGTNASTIRGVLAMYSMQSATLTNTTVRGATSQTLQMSPTNSSLDYTSLLLDVTTNSVLDGPLTLNGGYLSNSFTFDGTSTLSRTVINAPESTASGTTNSLDLASVVNGNFTFTGGGGTNTITIESTATIYAGNLAINLGNGTETYNLGGTFQVFGNMTMTAGTGGLNLGQIVSAFNGTVTGTLSISWGSGSNMFYLGQTGPNEGSVGAFNYTLANGADNFISIQNDSFASNNITITVPAVDGSYDLDLIFSGSSGIPQSVTATGGTTNSTGTIAVSSNGDTINSNSTNLLGVSYSVS